MTAPASCLYTLGVPHEPVAEFALGAKQCAEDAGFIAVGTQTRYQDAPRRSSFRAARPQW